jgi:hypothetical protein
MSKLFTTEIIIVAVSIVIFYLRIAMLRGQKKRYEREYALKRRKIGGRSKGAALPKQEAGSPPYGVNSWFFVALAIIFMLAGVVAFNKFYVLGWQIISDDQLVETLSQYWHWMVAVGVVGLSLCFKINKPIED